jgi:LysM repeat protein
MPDYQPNPVVRVFAVIALVAALILVVAVIATSGGGSDDGGSGSAQERSEGSNKRTQRALDRGTWIVRSGDTLGKVSQQTDIDVDVLIQLNPDLDPQALLEGQRIALR